MNITKLIKDNTCYIVSNNLKKEILLYLNDNKLLLDVHFFNLNQIIERIYFKYDDRAIYYISKNYNMSYSNAKLMIENIKYLMYSSAYNDEKIALLKKMKQDLDDNKLLEYDKTFLQYIKKYNIVSDLNLGDYFLYKINELLDNKIEFIKLEKKEEIIINEFKDSEDEIAYVANEICNLISNNVAPNKIHIINSNDAYNPYIDKIFTLYNIPFNIDSNNVLYELNEYRNLYKNHIEGISILKESEYTSSFNNIVSSLSFIKDDFDKNKYLLYILQTTKQQDSQYLNVINFSSYEGAYLDDNYYFFIGLNNKVFPSIKKDEDYISDQAKKQLGYIDSNMVNSLTRKYSLNRLTSNSNLFISYRNNDYFNKYLKSNLVDEIATKIANPSYDNKFSYSYDLVKITRELDDFYKYKRKSDTLINLLNKVKKDNYKTYNNSFSGIDSAYYLDNVLSNKISVSYTSFEKFYECNYKYYLDSILRENNNDFNTYIGNLFHYILEHIYDSDFDFERLNNNYVNEYTLSNKEIILREILLENFKDKIKIILKQYDNTKYKIIEKEKNISLYIKSQLSIKITGYIDKIMMDNEGHAYVIDYKTGENKLTLDYLDYGLKCQLPFYFYLLNKSKEYADIFLVGCYLQLINFKIRNYKDTSKELLLQGLTYEDESIISNMDLLYKEDSFIKGIKPNKNGLGAHSKTYNSDGFNRIITTMSTNIEKMIENIKNTNFNINPKIIKKKETTCKYCDYKDICYRSHKDFIDIRKVSKDEKDDMD